MPVATILSTIDELEKNASLYKEKCFDARADAVDIIEFGIIEQIETLLQKNIQTNELILLKHRSEKLKATLEKIDIHLFKKMRENIWSGKCRGTAFRNMVNEYVGLNLNGHNEEAGYDNLDLFINGLLPLHALPQQTKELEPEMVYYQKTPARIVFELNERCNFTKQDVFVDLGSGLGQIAILVNLLSGVTAKGIEFEPAFCEYAKACAAELNLPDITFINTDARQADYSEGTVFFMFTPFKGVIMQEVLALLKKESIQRKITVITYGPCTTQVALQKWLYLGKPKTDSIYAPAIFNSL